MKTTFAAIIALSFLLVAGSVHANSFIFAKSQVVADFPVSWRVENEGENVTFSTKDKYVAVSLAWAGNSLDEAWNILTAEVDKVVTGLKVPKNPGKTGAFTGFVGTGEGKLGTTDVRCYLSAVMTPGGAMTVFMLHPLGKEVPHKAAIAQFLDGLAPVK